MLQGGGKAVILVEGAIHSEVQLVRQQLSAIVGEGKPWEGDCYGPKGTAVLWHHRLLHMASKHKD